jgi:hypothetical protein
MKTIILLLMLVTTAATAQHEYLRIYQVTRSSELKDRGEINFDFGVKYDSSKVYAKLVAPKNLVAAIEFAESKRWEYVTTFVERNAASSPEYEYNVINVLMRRKGEE